MKKRIEEMTSEHALAMTRTKFLVLCGNCDTTSPFSLSPQVRFDEPPGSGITMSAVWICRVCNGKIAITFPSWATDKESFDHKMFRLKEAIERKKEINGEKKGRAEKK